MSKKKTVRQIVRELMQIIGCSGTAAVAGRIAVKLDAPFVLSFILFFAVYLSLTIYVFDED